MNQDGARRAAIPPQDGAVADCAVSPSERERFEARLYDVDAQRATVDDAVRTVREILIVFIVASAYLAITVLATTDKQLLIGGASLKLPIVNADINIVGFYLIAPWLVAVLHLNLLLKLTLLTRKLALFDNAVKAAERGVPSFADRLGPSERTRLASFPLAHVIAGPERNSALRRLLSTFVWILLVIWPLAVLHMALFRFLPYHGEFFTWLQRGAILFDLLVLWWLWPQILNLAPQRERARCAQSKVGVIHAVARAIASTFRSAARLVSQRPPLGAGPPAMAQAALQPRGAGRAALWSVSAVSSALLWIATYSGETLDRLKSVLSPDIGYVSANHTVEPLFPSSLSCHRGRCDWLTFFVFEATWSVLSRNLVVRDERLLKEDVRPEDVWDLQNEPWSLAKLAKFSAIDLRGRDLRYADLTRSVLVKARMGRNERDTPANLTGARLHGAVLIHAEASTAILVDADLSSAILDGADFRGVNAQRANLSKATIRRAHFDRAQLQYSNFEQANLERATFREADLREARLSKALSRKADFSTENPPCPGHLSIYATRLGDEGARVVDLRGADLRQASLEGANLSGANLSGALLQWTLMWNALLRCVTADGANLDDARLSGADLSGMRALGASFRRAWLHVATFANSNIRGADLREARLYGSDLDKTRMGGADFRFARLHGTRTQGADFEYVDMRGYPHNAIRHLDERTFRTISVDIDGEVEDTGEFRKIIEKLKRSIGVRDDLDGPRRPSFIFRTGPCLGVDLGVCGSHRSEWEFSSAWADKAMKRLLCDDPDSIVVHAIAERFANRDISSFLVLHTSTRFLEQDAVTDIVRARQVWRVLNLPDCKNGRALLSHKHVTSFEKIGAATQFDSPSGSPP